MKVETPTPEPVDETLDFCIPPTAMMLTTHTVEQQLAPFRVLEAEYVAAVVIEGVARLLIGSARRKNDLRTLACSITTQLNRMINRRSWQPDSFRILLLSPTPFPDLVSETPLDEASEAVMNASDRVGVTSCHGIEAELEYLVSLNVDDGFDPDPDETPSEDTVGVEVDQTAMIPPAIIRVTVPARPVATKKRLSSTRPPRSSTTESPKSHNQQRVDYLNQASRIDLAWVEEIEIGLTERILTARPWRRVKQLAPKLFGGCRTPSQVALFKGLMKRFPDQQRMKRRRRR